MARVRIWGAEMGDFSDVIATSGTLSIVSSPVGTGTYALRVNPTTTGTGYAAIKGLISTGELASTSITFATGYYQFRFRYATKPGSNSEEICQVVSGATAIKATLRLTSTGTLDLYNQDGTTLRATGSTVLSADTWYTLQLTIGTDSGGGVDDSTYELKINGSSEYSGSNLDATATANTGILLGKVTNRNSQTVDFFYDDVIIDDAAYPDTSAVVGVLQPDSAGNYSGATAGTYADVDELPHDGDTTYLTWTSNTNRHSAALESSATAGISGTIVTVQPYGIGRKTTTSTRVLVLATRNGSTDSDSGTGSAIPTSYTFFGGKILATDPSDSGAWTTTKLDSLEVNARVSTPATTTEHRVTAMGVMVEYIPAASTKAPVLIRRAARWFSSRR